MNNGKLIYRCDNDALWGNLFPLSLMCCYVQLFVLENFSMIFGISCVLSVYSSRRCLFKLLLKHAYFP